MTAFEVYKLYKNKSWRWNNGAGRMMDADRRFAGWVADAKGKSWATGRWIVTEKGKLCLDATWHTEIGAVPVKTCFSHSLANGSIYQRREPDGAWYVFRHAEVRSDDEIRKLVPEDLVSRQRDTIKAALDAVHLAKQ